MATNNFTTNLISDLKANGVVYEGVDVADRSRGIEVTSGYGLLVEDFDAEIDIQRTKYGVYARNLRKVYLSGLKIANRKSTDKYGAAVKLEDVGEAYIDGLEYDGGDLPSNSYTNANNDGIVFDHGVSRDPILFVKNYSVRRVSDGGLDLKNGAVIKDSYLGGGAKLLRIWNALVVAENVVFDLRNGSTYHLHMLHPESEFRYLNCVFIDKDGVETDYPTRVRYEDGAGRTITKLESRDEWLDHPFFETVVEDNTVSLLRAEIERLENLLSSCTTRLSILEEVLKDVRIAVDGV